MANKTQQMSQGLKDVSAGDPSASTYPQDSYQRYRPGPKERDGNKSDWAQMDDAAMKSKQHNTKKKRSKPKGPDADKIPAFEPGKYPVIFDTTTLSVPVVNVDTVYESEEIFDHAFEALQQLKYDPEFLQYFESMSFGGGVQRTVVESNFVAMSGLAAAQNLVHTCRENNRDFGGLSYMTRTDIIHAETIQQIASQYGFFVQEDTRENYVPFSVAEQAARFVRTANRIANARTISFDVIRSINRGTGWLPVRFDDPTAEIYIKSYISQYIATSNLDWLDARKTPLWAEPPWWNSVPQAVQTDLEPWYTSQPTDEATWIKKLNSLTATWFVSSKMKQPVDATGAVRPYAVPDLAFTNWSQNTRTNWVTLTTRANVAMQSLTRFLNCASTKSARSVMGTTAVLSDFTATLPTVLFKSITPVVMTQANLFVSFPIVMRQVTSTHDLSALYSAVRDLTFERKSWIQNGIKRSK